MRIADDEGFQRFTSFIKLGIIFAITAALAMLQIVTEEIDTSRIKAQCAKHNADYIEIGDEKLCVKEIK